MEKPPTVSRTRGIMAFTVNRSTISGEGMSAMAEGLIRYSPGQGGFRLWSPIGPLRRWLSPMTCAFRFGTSAERRLGFSPVFLQWSGVEAEGFVSLRRRLQLLALGSTTANDCQGPAHGVKTIHISFGTSPGVLRHLAGRDGVIRFHPFLSSPPSFPLPSPDLVLHPPPSRPRPPVSCPSEGHRWC